MILEKFPFFILLKIYVDGIKKKNKSFGEKLLVVVS
jgi:hypothetical protein